MSKALEILNRSTPNTAGLLVLSAQEVEAIKGELEALCRTEKALHDLLGARDSEVSECREKIGRNDTYIKYQNKHIAKLEAEISRLGGAVKDRGDVAQSLSCSMFGGKHSDQYNALRSALTTAAKEAGYEGEYCEYGWVEKTPRTSLVVNLVDALHSHGYEIKKR